MNNELECAENPARELLDQLGWSYLPASELRGERGDEREVLLRGRLRAALLRLNEWLSSEQAERVIFNLEHLEEGGMGRNQKVHEYLIFGMPLDVDGAGGRRTRSVQFFDFDHPEGGRNEFVVTTQFRVGRGRGETVIPDIVLFVNGIPLVVMEAKSPDLGLWRPEAVKQLHRYQELGPQWRGRGAPDLFHYNLLCVAHCGMAAVYAGLYAPENLFFEWKSIHPYTDEEVKRRFGVEPQGQARLIIGLLSPAVLLDILRDYVVFETRGGKMVKKLPRYQQYRAVRETLGRILRGETPEERGGVIWHTQGSGKSLTMLWLAVKLRRQTRLGALDNPTILIVTDRTQLDRQIAATFAACDFPSPEQAKTSRHLRRLLTTGVGRTVMTTVQKFEEALEEDQGALDPGANVVVMVDEAHRTQYGILAARMSQALPNAALIGFTGTPIDKGFERSTMRRFGPLIDSYTIPQSVEDKATVPIRYELRKPELALADGKTLDRVFEAVFGHLSPDEQERIRRRYANRETLAGADSRIRMIALDIAEHFKTKIRPNGFKAQVVAPRRETALKYARYLRDFGITETYPIITVTADDGTEYDEVRSLPQEKIIIDFVNEPIRFDEDEGEASPEILVVVDRLLTGFDAPVEQVLYLDKHLQEHSLLQAIARVNRTHTHQVGGTTVHKNYGLVVDYYGVAQDLEKALAGFKPEDVREAMTPLETGRAAEFIGEAAAKAESHFRGLDLDDRWACAAVFASGPDTEGEYREDRYQLFNRDYREFARLMDQYLPDPGALAYVKRLRRLTEIRQVVRAQYHEEDAHLDWTDIGAKAKQLIDEQVSAEVRELMKPLSILDRDFAQVLDGVDNERARASVMEHAVRRVINRRMDDNPVFYQKLSDQLEQIIGQLRLGTIDDLEACRRMGELGERMRDEEGIAARQGHTPRSFAIRELLAGEMDEPTAETAERGEMEPYREEFGREMDDLAKQVDGAVAAHTGLIDWRDNLDAQRQMRRDIKRRLREGGEYSPEQLERLARRIVEIAKRRTGAGENG